MKILLKIQYNGKFFCGWQRQNNAISVQEVLETQISALLDQPITLVASGRTDSGVHAFCQTAHFETTSNFNLEKLPFAINAKLPNGVRVLEAKKVGQNFHARFSVKKKTYLYRTYASQIALPLFEETHAKISPKVLQNFEAVQTSAQALCGTHNFKAFSASGTNAKNFVRTIFEIKIKKNKNFLDFYISGNGFLYNMVRIIVGTLVAVGEGKILPQNIPEILRGQNRTKAGKTMPAHGLYLFNVKYK